MVNTLVYVLFQGKKVKETQDSVSRFIYVNTKLAQIFCAFWKTANDRINIDIKCESYIC